MKKFLGYVVSLFTLIFFPSYAIQDIYSPLPGEIYCVHVHSNQYVTQSTPLFTVDFMKMHHVIQAESDGYIHELNVSENDVLSSVNILLARLDDNPLQQRENDEEFDDIPILLDTSGPDNPVTIPLVDWIENELETSFLQLLEPDEFPESTQQISASSVATYTDKLIFLSRDISPIVVQTPSAKAGSPKALTMQFALNKIPEVSMARNLVPVMNPSYHKKEYYHIVAEDEKMVSNTKQPFEFSIHKKPLPAMNSQYFFSRELMTYLPIVTNQIFKGILLWILLSLCLQCLYPHLEKLFFRRNIPQFLNPSLPGFIRI